MRKTFAMLLLTLVLAMGAAGCSEDTGTGGNDNSILGDNTLEDGTNVDDGQAGGADEQIKGSSYEQMLRNARVHDSDGILTDGENSVTP